MSSYLDALLAGAAAATKLATSTSGVFVDVGAAPPPVAKQVLTATSPSTATWQVAQASGDLETNVPGAPVDISGAAPPVEGQVLTATSPTTAIWRVPGLHYDPAIKSWTSTIGSATIAPGTWGFVEQAVGATAPIVVYIVSSLAAPPVDSRFALYVGRDVTVPVTVSVLGASQIQGLDGVLGPSTELLPGADYEWVFYHEDGAALWGLVSDTAGMAKRLAVSDGFVDIAASPAPLAGQALIAIDSGTAAWGDIEGSTLAALAEAFEDSIYVDAIVYYNSDLYGNSGGSETDGIGYGQEILVLAVAQSDPTENGFWQTYDGPWTRPADYPVPPPVGTTVLVTDGTVFAGSMWVYLSGDEWYQISPGSPITGGDFMVRVGNKIHLVGPISDTVHGNRGGGALHAAATTTVNGFFTGAEKVKLAGIATSAAAVTNTVPSTIQIIGAGVVGVATDAARQDHGHFVSAAAPVALTLAASNSSGTSTSLARADHIHALPASATVPTALTVAGSGSAGSSVSISKADHVHPMPNIATSGASGFMSNTDKAKSDSIANLSALTIGNVLTANASTTAVWLPPSGAAENNLRISVSNAVSVPADGTYSTVYLTPWNGLHISLFIPLTSGIVAADGVYHVQVNTAAIPSIAIAGAVAGRPIDIFAYAVNTTARIALELQHWTSATARSVSISQSTYGFWMKGIDATRRYVGTILPSSATQYVQALTGGGTTPAICGIWNQDNRVPLQYSWQATTSTYTIPTASAWLPYDGVTTSRITGVCGIQCDSWPLTMVGSIDCKTFACAVGIGADSSSSASGFRTVSNSAAGVYAPLISTLNARPSEGVHNFYALLFATATTTAIAAGTLSPGQLGLIASIPC